MTPGLQHEPEVTLSNILATIKSAEAGLEARDRRVAAFTTAPAREQDAQLEARIGGSVICPNAARLLRVR